jgi:hypothetical protein
MDVGSSGRRPLGVTFFQVPRSSFCHAAFLHRGSLEVCRIIIFDRYVYKLDCSCRLQEELRQYAFASKGRTAAAGCGNQLTPVKNIRVGSKRFFLLKSPSRRGLRLFSDNISCKEVWHGTCLHIAWNIVANWRRL